MKSTLVLIVVVAAAVAAVVWLKPSGLDELAPEAADGDTSALVTEAESLHDAGDHARSAVLYRQASEAAAEAGDDDLALAYRAQSAVCLKKAGDTDEALGIMEAALTESRERGVRRVEGLALGNLARLNDLKGRFERGLAYRDELVDFALADGDTRLGVWTLEQAAAAAIELGDADGAIARIDRALSLDDQLLAGDRRADALRRQRAWAQVVRGDDEGAAAAWQDTEASGASLANRAQHLSLLGRHVEAAEAAFAAAEAFERAGSIETGERDRAMLLWIRELIRGRQIEQADKALFQLLGQADGDEVSEDVGEELAGAPFRAMLARVAMAQGRFDDALADLERARGVLEREAVAPDDAEARAAFAQETFEIDVLRVVTFGWLERLDEAQALVEELAPSQARGVLRLWLATRSPDRRWLARDGYGALEPTAEGLDGSVRRLREALPFDFPPVASLLMDATFGDIAALRASVAEGDADPPAVAEVRATGARLALVWQALERIDDVAGLSPAPMMGEVARVDRWVAGDLPEGVAIAAVVVGDTQAQFVLCLPGRPVALFGISPPARLAQLVGAAVEGLRAPDAYTSARAAHELTKEVVPKAALADLEAAGIDHVTWILPHGLGAFPPAAYVLSPPMPRQPVSWMVYRFTHALLPHALVGGEGVSVADDARSEWLRFGAPEVDPASAPFATGHLADVYGGGALASSRLRVSDEPAIEGAGATAVALREALPSAVALELSAPAFGGGRLGGVLVTPSDEALLGDERGGFVPWHRWAELPLPPLVILDRARFGVTAGDTPDLAATALMARAQAVLLTRWPSPVEPELMLRRIIEGLRAGAPLGDAVTFAQRDFLLLTRDEPAQQHPRNWGPWLSYSLR